MFKKGELRVKEHFYGLYQISKVSSPIYICDREPYLKSQPFEEHGHTDFCYLKICTYLCGMVFFFGDSDPVNARILCDLLSFFFLILF